MAPPLEISAFATTQLALLTQELAAETQETHLLTSTHAPSVLARAGLAILNLNVAAQRTGLGGKTLVDLALDNAVAGSGEGGKELGEHGLRVGDIVGVAEQPKGAEKKKVRAEMEAKLVQGVVVRVGREALVVALDRDEVDIPQGRLWMCVGSRSILFRPLKEAGMCLGVAFLADSFRVHSVKLANDVTYKRCLFPQCLLSIPQPYVNSMTYGVRKLN